MLAHRCSWAFAALGTVALTAGDAGAAQSLECRLAGPGVLACSNGRITLRMGEVVEPALAKAAPTHARVVYFNYSRACALDANGVLGCWGDNDSAQLGDGTRVHRDTPVRVLDIDAVSEVALGRTLTCALRRSGKIACWGYDDATGTYRLRSTEVPSLSHAVEIAAGGSHACAREQDGSVWCWGNNRYGQLGDGTQKNRARPVRVTGLSGAVELSAGLSHTCARKQNGTVWCWGNGWGGEDGTANRLLVPSAVASIHAGAALLASVQGLYVWEKDGPLVTCRYTVDRTRSESSPSLVCQPAGTPGPSAFKELPIVIRLPQAP